MNYGSYCRRIGLCCRLSTDIVTGTCTGRPSSRRTVVHKFVLVLLTVSHHHHSRRLSDRNLPRPSPSSASLQQSTIAPVLHTADLSHRLAAALSQQHTNNRLTSVTMTFSDLQRHIQLLQQL